MPRVSVILSVFNNQRWVESAVRSVLAQTFADFELICVDDGSTDRSAAILERLASEDARIRIIAQPNGGVASAGNAGLFAARGDLIARLDSDDIALPERLAKQVAFMDAYPNVALLGTDYALIDDAGRFLTIHHQPQDNSTLQDWLLSGLIPIAHTSCMYRRDPAIRIGGYDFDFQSAEDLDLYLRLGEIGAIACLSEVLTHYRQHEESISERKQDLQMRMIREACERAWKRRGLSGIEFKARPWRATGSRDSRYEQCVRFGWWSYKSGSRSGPLHYGLKAARICPWKIEGYKLLYRGLLKPAPPAKADLTR